MSNKTVGFGLTTWGEESATGNRSEREDIPKIPFMRLKDGNNLVRIITDPYKYFSVRFKSVGDKYGRKINSAWPKHDDCPAKAAGLKPKKRYMVGVIDRADGDVKMLDMSVMVYEQLKIIREATNNADPKDFDINIRVNRNAPATNYYMVMAQPATPLSAADVQKKTALGPDVEKVLVYQTTPPSPDVVLKRMQKFGYTGGSLAEDAGDSNTGLQDSDDDDYSFSAPAQA